MGHQLVLGNHVGTVGFGGEESLHASDQRDLACGESGFFGAGDSEFATDIADVHRRDVEYFCRHDVERTQGV